MWQFPGGRKIVCHTTLYIINSRLESPIACEWSVVVTNMAPILLSAICVIRNTPLHKSGFVFNFIKTDIRYSYFNAAPTSKDYDVYCTSFTLHDNKTE